MKHTVLIRIASLLLALCLLTLGNLFAVSAVDDSSSQAGQPRSVEELLTDLGRTQPFTAEEKALLHEYLVANAQQTSQETRYILASDLPKPLIKEIIVTVAHYPDGTKKTTRTVIYNDQPESIPMYYKKVEKFTAADGKAGEKVTVRRVTTVAGEDVEELVECYIVVDGIKASLMETAEIAHDAGGNGSDGDWMDQLVSLVVRGDGDGNGVCDVFDAVRILSYIVSQGSLTRNEKLAMNVDGSSNVDVFDAVAILTFIVSGEWK